MQKQLTSTSHPFREWRSSRQKYNNMINIVSLSNIYQELCLGYLLEVGLHLKVTEINDSSGSGIKQLQNFTSLPETMTPNAFNISPDNR